MLEIALDSKRYFLSNKSYVTGFIFADDIKEQKIPHNKLGSEFRKYSSRNENARLLVHAKRNRVIEVDGFLVVSAEVLVGISNGIKVGDKFAHLSGVGNKGAFVLLEGRGFVILLAECAERTIQGADRIKTTDLVAFKGDVTHVEKTKDVNFITFINDTVIYMRED